MPGENDPLVVVLGPTASGKSALALDIAARFGGEIVGCDSLQIYRYFDIGTARTPPAERRGIPHHLLEIAQPTDIFTAGDYSRLARAAIAEISGRRRLPVVVGGSGFYLRALLQGLFPGAGRNPELRATLIQREQRRAGLLHRLLRRLDPVAAARIHPNDFNKQIRAIEVCLSERRPMTDQFGKGRDPLTGYRIIRIGLDPPRPELHARIDARVTHMFDSSLIDEVREILQRRCPRTAKPFESLGYKEALAVVEGRLSTTEAIRLAQNETRQYAKRQMTWFRREPDVVWIKGFGDSAAVRQTVLQQLQQELGAAREAQ